MATLALVALISTGCGSTATSTTRATGSAGASGGANASGSAGSSGHEKATDRDKAVKFAECMRQNGVSDFPDPEASGDFVYGVSVTPTEWQAALRACKDLQPPGSLSGKRSTQQQSAALRFARCIRDNGVKDFPDPVNGEPLVDTNRIPSANRDGGMSILNAAMRKCGKLVADAAGRRP